MTSKTNEITFSVIIPTYNHAHLIQKCLNSVLTQLKDNWEVIVVNNFSDDNTVEIVNNYNDSRIKIFNYANNGVIAASRNFGFKMSKGKWICFLDSDDWYADNRFAELLKIDIENYDLIYHSLHIVTNGIITGDIPVRQLKRNAYKDLLFNLNTIPTSSTCIRREFFQQSGGFNEATELIGVEDFDLWIRFGKQKMRAKLIDKSLGFYYIGNTNVTYTDERQITRLNAVYNQYIDLKNNYLFSLKTQAALNYLIAKVYLTNFQFEKARIMFLKALFNGSLAIKIRSIYHLPSTLKGNRKK